jgi:hypothetical protein
MTASELKAQLQRSKAESDALSQLWMCLIGPAPDARYFHSLIYKHGYDATKSAVERTAVKFSQLNGTMTDEYAVKYCASCAKNAKTRIDMEQQGHQTLSENTLMKHATLRTRSR